MKMNRLTRTIIIILMSALCLNAGAQERRDESSQAENPKAIKGFSGGMMVHTGYLYGCDNPFDYNTSGATFGIGGVARIHLGKQFRVGFEGYFSSMGLHEKIVSGSYNKLFWAGALADRYWKFGKFYPYIGMTVGGGTETAFYIFEGNKHDWAPEPVAVYHKQPFFAVDPFVGVEYKVGKALRLMLKADWLLAIHSGSLNRPQGPRLYFGCIFAH